jgi:hypothetical protein
MWEIGVPLCKHLRNNISALLLNAYKYQAGYDEWRTADGLFLAMKKMYIQSNHPTVLLPRTPYIRNPV